MAPIRFLEDESGQALVEYSWLTYALLVGAGALGWPFLRRLAEAWGLYVDGLHFTVNLPFP